MERRMGGWVDKQTEHVYESKDLRHSSDLQEIEQNKYPNVFK